MNYTKSNIESSSSTAQIPKIKMDTNQLSETPSVPKSDFLHNVDTDKHKKLIPPSPKLPIHGSIKEPTKVLPKHGTTPVKKVGPSTVPVKKRSPNLDKGLVLRKDHSLCNIEQVVTECPANNSKDFSDISSGYTLLSPGRSKSSSKILEKNPVKIKDAELLHSKSEFVKEVCSQPIIRKHLSKPTKNLIGSNVELNLKNRKLKDIKSLKQDFNKIEIVFERRRSKDAVTKKKNSDILNRILHFVYTGEVNTGPKLRFQEKVSNQMTHYLCIHRHLLTQLVLTVSDCEDAHTCIYAIKILHQLIVKNVLADQKTKLAIRKKLNFTSSINTLIESLYIIHIRFSSNDYYWQNFQDLYYRLLQIILLMSRGKSHRKQIQRASVAAIQFIGRLIFICEKHKNLAEALLNILTRLCLKKSNCEILSNRRFFDGLCRCFKLTFKMDAIIIILKVMSRHKLVVEEMSGNEKIFAIVLDLVNYNGKKILNKRALLTTLYRISRNDSGIKILCRHEFFSRLYHYFEKNEKGKQLQYRLGTIKAYTILHLCLKKIFLPAIEPNRQLHLPENVQKCLEEEHVSDESDPENDDSDDTNEDDDSDDGAAVNDVSKKDFALKKKVSNTSNSIPTDILTLMYQLFLECRHTIGDTDKSHGLKFKLYEGITQLTNTKILAHRVHRGVGMDIHAYPDAAMIESESDEHVLKPKVNFFNAGNLAYKLKLSKNGYENPFRCSVVFDLDELHRNPHTPTNVPHPSTFVPKKEKDPLLLDGTVLEFESRFECGNLRKATQVGRYEYDLLLSPDTNTAKGFQWFYFQISRVLYGVPYTFNIINFLKNSSQFNYGMQPLMFSVTDYALHKKGWKRVGEEVIYYGNNYRDEAGVHQYKTLSFTVYFQYYDDYIYFAYHYPYTYTRLMTKLFPLVNYTSNDILVRLDKLCNTVNTSNELALLTITGSLNRSETLGIPYHKRPIIFITARVHSGETNASWIMEGVINSLLDAANVNAIKAREHFVFKIIPMLNPEGVIYGNTRNGLTGHDLNRCWANPHKITCPEIYYAKKVIECAKRALKLPISAYIDIHGHSRKKFVFFYGCNPKMSWNKHDRAGGDHSDLLKILPETMHSLNSNLRLGQCKYKIEKCRESTGRVVMWREFDIKHSYTLECSFSFGSKNQSVNTKLLTDTGISVVASLGKIADRVHMCRKSLASFSLDYCWLDNPRIITDKRHLTTTPLKEELENRRRTVTMAGSEFDNLEEPLMTPMFINSRVMGKPYY